MVEPRPFVVVSSATASLHHLDVPYTFKSLEGRDYSYRFDILLRRITAATSKPAGGSGRYFD